MKFVNRFIRDLEENGSEIVFYMFSNFDIEMLDKIYNYTGHTRTIFIFGQSPFTFTNQYNYNRSINSAISKSGYESEGIKQYNLDEITDLDVLEKSVRKKYRSSNYSPTTYRYFKFRPYLKRYVLKKKDLSTGYFVNNISQRKILLYHIIFDPIAVFEFLNFQNERIDGNLKFDLVINKFDSRYGDLNLLQLNKKIMTAINPEFIISPQKYWLSDTKKDFLFKDSEGLYAPPIKIDDKFSIVHKKEHIIEREELFGNYRELIIAGLID